MVIEKIGLTPFHLYISIQSNQWNPILFSLGPSTWVADGEKSYDFVCSWFKDLCFLNSSSALFYLYYLVQISQPISLSEKQQEK